MNDKLENILVNTAPTLYKEYKMSEMDSCMAFGMECDDGWFFPLLEASKKLEEINNVIKKYHHEIIATQVKEKYGELRFYYTIQHKKIFQIKRIVDMPKPSFFNDKLIKPKNMTFYCVKYFFSKVINFFNKYFIQFIQKLINEIYSSLTVKKRTKFYEFDEIIEKEINYIISEAEVKCFERCEICGSKRDVTSTKGWIKRVCSKCNKKVNKNDKNK